MIVLLQLLPELLNKSRSLKVKTSTLPGCEESVTSRILKKPEVHIFQFHLRSIFRMILITFINGLSKMVL